MKAHRLHCRWATFWLTLLTLGCVLMLAACQGLGGGGGGGGGSVVLSSNNLNFGTVTVGNSKTLQDSLSNNTSSSVTIVAAQGTNSTFQLIGLSFPLTLAAGQSAPFSVQFQPTSPGDPSATISFMGNGGQSYASLAVSGDAVEGQLSANPSSIDFGNVQVGSDSGQSVTLTNTGGSSLTISAASVSGSGFSFSGLSLPLTLNAGQNTSFTVKFAPTASGPATGNVTITSNGSNSTLTIPLSGNGVTPGTLSANPTSLAFPSVQVGSSANLSETLTNTGGSSVTISQANVSGAAFSISGLTLPTTLTPNQSVTFTATFTPTATGSASGTLSIVSNASNSPLNIALSGTGTAAGQLAVSPSSWNFGNVAVGSSSPLNASLNATGASVTVSSGASNSSEFVLSGITFPVTIPAGQSAPFTVTFEPNATGTANASLTFTSNASNSPTTQSLTGTGTSPQHWVSLTWNASTGATTYNVYRKAPSDQNYTQIDSGDGTTAYTDNNVTAGQTYDYVVTAVNSENEESGYSNMVQVTIPTS